MNTLLTVEEIRKEIADNKMVLLYISSEQCGVCHVIFPRLQQILSAFPRIKSCKVDINQVSELAGSFNVFTIPCVLLFIEGKETIREARYIVLDRLKERLQRYYDMLFCEGDC